MDSHKSGALDTMSLGSDDACAVQIALAGGKFLLEQRGRRLGAPRQPVDAAANRLIIEMSSAARPDDAVLSEEVAPSDDRLAAKRVWIIDPLDGTREYGEADRSDWAVHVALWEYGRLTAAAVALPARQQVWSTADRPVGGVDRPIRRIAVSRSRPPAWAEAVADHLGADLVAMGSAGAKAIATLTGEVDAYVHGGGQYEWDSAAPVAVAMHHGMHASRADGSRLIYNQPDPWLPDLVICPREGAAGLLAAIARAVAGDELPKEYIS